ncbi:MAG: rRNA maturation RNase YbeY [Ferruginibacter sp.]
MGIKFFFNNVSFKLLQRKKLKAFIEDIFKKEIKALLSLNYIFCNDDFLLSINQEFLNHNQYTDIITFSLSQPEKPIEGEIYISTDRIKHNAVHLGEDKNIELHRVIFHGALHLCGYKDKTKADKERMTFAENKYLSKYFS